MLDRVDVLVVDDSAMMRAIMREVLRPFGVRRIVEADNADQAWEILKQTPAPDLVFIDWIMPDPDGLAFINKVRKAPDSPNPYIPLIVVTGHTEVWRVEQARDAGASSVLCKPVAPKKVLEHINRVIFEPQPFVRGGDYFGPDRRRREMPEWPFEERRASKQKGAEVEGGEGEPA